MWHGANCGGVRENCCTDGSCSLLIPGELKVAALKRNVFTTRKMWREEKNVNICGWGGVRCNPLIAGSPGLWNCSFSLIRKF